MLTAVLAGSLLAVGTAPAGAEDTPVSCATGAVANGGAAVSLPFTVAIDGVTMEPSAPGRYGRYWVLVCKDPTNRDYNVFAGLYQPNVSGGEGRFTPDDLDTEFTVSFLPEAGTVPLMAQGHGNMSSFTIDSNDSNRVTLVTKPIAYSDIYGSDCGNLQPVECIAAVRTTRGDRASADNIEVRVSIRYADSSTGGGPDFQVLQGMRWSSSAFLFWMRTSCPTVGATSSAITVDLGGPHLRSDGSQNLGSVEVFIPTAGVIACFGAPPSLVQDSLTMTRTEAGRTLAATTGGATDVGLEYTVTADDASGLTISIPQVSFSRPVYKVRTRSGRALARLRTSNASALRAARLSTPRGGSYTVTSATPAICASVRNGVFGYRKGVCGVTVTTYDRAGRRVASRTVTFRV